MPPQEKILLLAVDDDPVMLTLYKSILERDGFAVSAVESAEDGIALFEREPFPLCIIDWMLPGIDGVEMVQRLRKLPGGEDSILIMITAKNQQKDLETVLQAGANDYIEKPVSPGQLRVRLRIALKTLDDLQARRAGERNSRLMSRVFENSVEGIIITDEKTNILYTNKAFGTITGFSLDEVLGKTPSLLASGKHDENFYRTMWMSLLETGNWQGEIWNRRKSGEIYPEWLSINAVLDDGGKVRNYVAQFSDLSIRKKNEERLNYLANHDLLTDLPNRSYLVELLSLAIERSEEKRIGVIFLDLDRFKIVNDSLSHGAGDLLLQEVAGRLKMLRKKYSFLARSGGDEFVLVHEELQSASQVANLASEILNILSPAFSIDRSELYISASIGICMYPEDGAGPKTLLRNSEIAMYQAKEGGRNRYQFYSHEMNNQVFQRLTLETSLRRGIEQEAFHLMFQPIIKATTGRTVGMEALVRWNHPDLGLIPPSQFIPLAEETGLIVPLGDWILKTALGQAMEWRQKWGESFFIAINVSAKQFYQKDYVQRVEALLRESGFPAQDVELELTESVFMQDIDETLKTLFSLKALGLKLSIDDFGTGYSSFQYLKRLPLDVLKIDKSFVWDIGSARQSDAIISAIVSVGHSLELSVIAEGVESDNERAFLARAGVDLFQGYFFSQPLTPVDFESFFRSFPVGVTN